jgi:Host cell surface-exposed lipoprotein/Protein of unknown function (DUF2510)
MTQPAPGWFPDPSDPSRQRYFDGRAWTENYAPLGATTPGNGQPAKPGMSRGGKLGLWLVGMVLVLIAIGSLNHNNTRSSSSSSAGSTTYAFAPTTAESPPTPTDNFTPGEENAIAKAKTYLSVDGFSKQGLIKQLAYDSFSTADATFAVDNIEAAGDVNWK